MDKHEKGVHCALKHLDEQIQFVFHKVSTDFDPQCSFSSVTFCLSAYADNETRLGVSVSDLFKWELKPEYSKYFETTTQVAIVCGI